MRRFSFDSFGLPARRSCSAPQTQQKAASTFVGAAFLFVLLRLLTLYFRQIAYPGGFFCRLPHVSGCKDFSLFEKPPELRRLSVTALSGTSGFKSFPLFEKLGGGAFPFFSCSLSSSFVTAFLQSAPAAHVRSFSPLNSPRRCGAFPIFFKTALLAAQLSSIKPPQLLPARPGGAVLIAESVRRGGGGRNFFVLRRLALFDWFI